MKIMIKCYLTTDDRSVGPCSLPGKGGVEGTKGGQRWDLPSYIRVIE